jgi:hypothetical protein
VFIAVPGRVRPIGRVTSAVIPAAELAIICHHGSLAGADLSYATLGSYATTHEISIDGPLREYYLRGAGDTPDERTGGPRSAGPSSAPTPPVLTGKPCYSLHATRPGNASHQLAGNRAGGRHRHGSPTPQRPGHGVGGSGGSPILFRRATRAVVPVGADAHQGARGPECSG